MSTSLAQPPSVCPCLSLPAHVTNAPLQLHTHACCIEHGPAAPVGGVFLRCFLLLLFLTAFCSSELVLAAASQGRQAQPPIQTQYHQGNQARPLALSFFLPSSFPRVDSSLPTQVLHRQPLNNVRTSASVYLHLTLWYHRHYLSRPSHHPPRKYHRVTTNLSVQLNLLLK